jgi:hypothetical protein
VSAHDAVPCGAVLLVEFLLDEGCYVLLHGELFQGLEVAHPLSQDSPAVSDIHLVFYNGTASGWEGITVGDRPRCPVSCDQDITEQLIVEFWVQLGSPQ